MQQGTHLVPGPFPSSAVCGSLVCGVAFGGVLLFIVGVFIVGIVIRSREVTAGGDGVSWVVRERVGREVTRDLPGGSCRPWHHHEVWGAGGMQ